MAWVDRGGTALLQAGTYADDDSRRISEKAQFSIESVTKVFTAALFVQSRRDGRSHGAYRLRTSCSRLTIPLAAGWIVLRCCLLLPTKAACPEPLEFQRGAATTRRPLLHIHHASAARGLQAARARGTSGPGCGVFKFRICVLGQASAAAWGRDYASALQRHVTARMGEGSCQHKTLAGLATIRIGLD